VSIWRRWGCRLLIAVALALIILSFLPLWQTDRWWVRQWDYPRLQVAGLLIIVGGAITLGVITWRVRSSYFAAQGAIDAEMARIRAADEPLTTEEMYAYHRLPYGTADSTTAWLALSFRALTSGSAPARRCTDPGSAA